MYPIPPFPTNQRQDPRAPVLLPGKAPEDDPAPGSGDHPRRARQRQRLPVSEHLSEYSARAPLKGSRAFGASAELRSNQGEESIDFQFIVAPLRSRSTKTFEDPSLVHNHAVLEPICSPRQANPLNFRNGPLPVQKQACKLGRYQRARIIHTLFHLCFFDP